MDAIFVRAPESVKLDQIVRQAKVLLSDPGDVAEGLSWVTPRSLIRSVKRIQKGIVIAGGSIAFLSLILGGTALMSLMIASVRERVVEIGLRRALGATRRDIATLFLVEACLVTGLGGVCGVVVAYLLLASGKTQGDIPVVLGMKNAVIPVLVATLLGVVFSLWPARNAAGIAPSEALRSN